MYDSLKIKKQKTIFFFVLFHKRVFWNWGVNRIKLILPRGLTADSTTTTKIYNMSDNTSTMNPTTDQIKALQAMDKTMRNLLAAFGVEGSVTAPAKKGRGRTKTAASSDTSAPADAKPKREINPKIAEMNVERKAIYTEMVNAWKTANPDYASLSKGDLSKAVADGKVSKPPSYPDALKEHSRRLNEREPDRAAKRAAAADAKSKSDDKSSVKSDNNTATLNDAASAATTDAPKKRRGPKALKDMTEDERTAHKAKMAERKAAKNNTAAATSTTSNAAPAPAPAPATINSPVAPQPPKSTAPEIITGDDDDPETLKPWSFENTNYYKNDLGYVYEVNGDEPGDYIGRYTIKKGRKYIDTDVPEPGA